MEETSRKLLGAICCRAVPAVLVIAAGAAYGVSVLSLTERLDLFWLAFIVILVASFVPEWTWKKYS